MQVRITIRGREYTVRGDDHAGQMQSLAVDLDRRMSEMAERTRSFDEYTIAIRLTPPVPYPIIVQTEVRVGEVEVRAGEVEVRTREIEVRAGEAEVRAGGVG